MNDAIGARGWCKKCKHGETKQESVYCESQESRFYGQRVNSILCSPCFVPDESKADIKVDAVGFSS
jgi:hypothetical protein